MKFKNPYLTNKEKIELLEKWIIIHSILYYMLGESLVTDKQYDDNCYQLVDMIHKFPNAFKNSRYYYAYHDFDGSTGYHLFGRLNREDNKRLYSDADDFLKYIKRGRI